MSEGGPCLTDLPGPCLDHELFMHNFLTYRPTHPSTHLPYGYSIKHSKCGLSVREEGRTRPRSGASKSGLYIPGNQSGGPSLHLPKSNGSSGTTPLSLIGKVSVGTTSDPSLGPS